MSFTSSTLLVLLRVRLFASVVSVIGVILAFALFLGALFSHHWVFGRAALFALSVSLLGNAVSEGWRALVLVNSGRWTTLDKRQVSRSDQPTRFWTWLTLHGLFAATYGAAAGYLTWNALTSAL